MSLDIPPVQPTDTENPQFHILQNMEPPAFLANGPSTIQEEYSTMMGTPQSTAMGAPTQTNPSTYTPSGQRTSPERNDHTLDAASDMTNSAATSQSSASSDETSGGSNMEPKQFSQELLQVGNLLISLNIFYWISGWILLLLYNTGFSKGALYMTIFTNVHSW
jgi:hypothetical protein